MNLTPAQKEPLKGPGRFLMAMGAVECVLLATTAWWPGRGFPFPGLGLVGGAFLAYALAARATGRAGHGSAADLEEAPMASADAARPPSTGASDALRSDRAALMIVWGWAVAVRLILLPLAPELTDDFYRYLWDGHVQLQGVNPYLHAPGDPALEALRTPWHGLINNPSVSTIYPPLAQVVFLLNALLGGTILGLKVVWLGLDLLTAWLLSRVAARSGRDPLGVLTLYLWSPLLILETAWNGHLETLGLVFVALLLYVGAHPVRVGLALGFATLAKFAPAAALPPLWRRYGWRAVLAFGLTLAVLYLPYAAAGSMLWGGLSTFAEHWRFQEGAFAVIEWVVPGPRAPRVVAGLIVLGVVGWTALRSYDAERSLFWILGAGLLLSHTIHPWYVLWALPFAALRRSRAWILLSGLVFLGYWGLETYHTQGVWPQPVWARLLLWTPVFALLAYDARRGTGRGVTG